MTNELVLENYGVQEMQPFEERDVDGGGVILGLGRAAWWAAVVTTIALHDAAEEIADGWNRAHADQNNHWN